MTQTQTPTITAFRWVPPFARGHVRDLRARWAFEETGQRYDVERIDGDQVKADAHRLRQPFGQVPTYADDEVAIFESGAITLHIARTAPGLLPEEPAARARAEQWVVAALNSVEPFVAQLAVCDIFEADKPWSAMRRPTVVDGIRLRLHDLSAALGDRTWLDGDVFTAGDLTMICVLRALHGSGLLDDHPNLAAYVARGEARPAYRRAMADHMADFDEEPAAA